jgi:hypothetical protein
VVSQEDLGLVRTWFDAWNTGDLATFVAMFDADAEVITIRRSRRQDH